MVKSLTMESKNEKAKNSLNTLKKGFVEKKKKQKFKEVPTGKVALINGSKAQNNKQNLQTKKGSPQKSSKGSKSPQGTNKNSKKELKKKNAMKPEEEEEDDTDSDEEINEGVELDSSILEESDDMSDEEESDDEDVEVTNILGASLADDTDEDDDDFEEQEELNEKKGVKMFKGVNKSADSSKDNSAMVDSDEVDEMEDSDDGDEEEDDDDDESEEAEESALGLKALIGNSIAEDDEDDEDFVEAEGDDDDDDITSEEEDEEEEEQNSLANPKSKNNKEKKEDNTEVSLQELKEDKRTIFVGNLPTNVTKKQLRKLFKEFGMIDTIRLRGMVPKELGMSKKVAAITKNIHPKIKSVYAYIRFVQPGPVKKALSMNGKEFEGSRLRVDVVDKSNTYDSKKSVFLGNLHFNIDENTIRKYFQKCGEIESVRVVRDGQTRMGKGFGYVNFKNADSVALALELDGTMLHKREVRVKPNIEQKSKNKGGKRSLSDSSGSDSPQKKSKIEAPGKKNKKNAMMRLAVKEQKGGETSPQQSKAFQGQKADAKKKKKNKADKKKKVIAEKLTAKPKKPSN